MFIFIVQAVSEAREIFLSLASKQFLGGYLASMWNWIDWANIVIYFMFASQYIIGTSETKWHPSVDGNCYLQANAFVQGTVWKRVNESYAWLLAFTLAITFWRTLKFLQVGLS